jgi:hypothetical protein
MGEIVNLNRLRKARIRAAAQVEAAENRVRHGRPKSVRAEASHDKNRLDQQLDGNRLE